MSEARQVIVATFDLFSVLVNACKRNCMHWKDANNATAFSSLALDPTHKHK